MCFAKQGALLREDSCSGCWPPCSMHRMESRLSPPYHAAFRRIHQGVNCLFQPCSVVRECQRPHPKPIGPLLSWYKGASSTSIRLRRSHSLQHSPVSIAKSPLWRGKPPRLLAATQSAAHCHPYNSYMVNESVTRCDMRQLAAPPPGSMRTRWTSSLCTPPIPPIPGDSDASIRVRPCRALPRSNAM